MATAQFKIRHDRAERQLAGRKLRDKCPRALHGQVILGQGDKRDIVGLIEDSNEDRLENLIPIRHGRMLQSAFAFYRGAAAIQAYDLAGTPSSGIIVQACGDCHLMNFGGFATPERKIVFDINDLRRNPPGPLRMGPQAAPPRASRGTRAGGGSGPTRPGRSPSNRWRPIGDR